MTHIEEVTASYEPKSAGEHMNGQSARNNEVRSHVSLDGADDGASASTSSPPASSAGSIARKLTSEGNGEMSSADSAGSAGNPSCGIVSSLFPSSCRGRAEAFARRLHRRLTSLGGSEDRPGEDQDETSWLEPSASGKSVNFDGSSDRPVHQRQPGARASPDTEFYYDLDMEDGPGSPAEVATAAELADILVNPKGLRVKHHDGCHCSPAEPTALTSVNGQDTRESCAFLSAISETSPDSDSSEAYYDPVSSDNERPKNEVFYDPSTATSDSEPKVELSPRKILHAKRTRDRDSSEDTSESSLSEKPLRERVLKSNARNSSDDSCNARSSPETTSPSHESLWSTFDESTVSLQDESPTMPSDPWLPKSHSDTEIPINGGLDDGKGEADEVDLASGFVENSRNGLEDTDERNYRRKTKSELSSDSRDFKVEVNEIDKDDATSVAGALALECQIDTRKDEPVSRNEVKSQIESDATANGEDEKLSSLLKRLGGSEDDETTRDEETTEEETRPQRVRRSSSLKTGKTPPGTPGRKKIVRFADVLGLDLADVRTFLDEIPKVPTSAYSDLVCDEIFQKDTSPVPASDTWSRYGKPGVSQRLDKTLVPLFQQPGGQPNFLDLVRVRSVCLENVIVEDPISLCIQGTVRVVNLDFHKSVHIRYSLNQWKSFSDLQAIYVANSCDGFSDKFSFVLYCHTLKVGQRLEFAVRFQCKGAQYWDNNAGANYCFQCLPTSSGVGYIPIVAREPSVQPSEWPTMFY